MAVIVKASLLLLVIKAAANARLPPASDLTGLSASLSEPAELLRPRDRKDEPTSTVIVTETTTLYATLIPPVLPAVTISTTRTSSLFTSTTTQIINLNCTATGYSPILAPTSVASLASLSVSGLGANAARQVTGSPGSTLSPAASSTNNPNVVTATIFATITATTTAIQRPAVTRTIYSVVIATQTNPFTRTVAECSATEEIFYTIETTTVTSTFSRTVWPSTTTSVTFVDCAPRPTISRAPPVRFTTPTTAVEAAKMERQIASIISTTIHQTHIIYTASM